MNMEDGRKQSNTISWVDEHPFHWQPLSLIASLPGWWPIAVTQTFLDWKPLLIGSTTRDFPAIIKIHQLAIPLEEAVKLLTAEQGDMLLKIQSVILIHVQNMFTSEHHYNITYNDRSLTWSVWPKPTLDSLSNFGIITIHDDHHVNSLWINP